MQQKIYRDILNKACVVNNVIYITVNQGCNSNRIKKFPDFSLTILRKIFVLYHKDIRHAGGTLKIVLLENAKMFQL